MGRPTPDTRLGPDGEAPRPRGALRRTLGRALPLLAVAGLWETTARSGVVDPDFLPPVTRILAAWADLTFSGAILPHLAASLYRALVGLVLAATVGTICGVWMARWRALEHFLDPLITLTYPLPKVAIIPLTMIWFGIGHLADVIVVFIGCLMPVVIHAFHGTRGADHLLIWSARAMGAGEREVLRRVLLPAALPSLLAGVRIALNFSFVLVIGAELVASRVGLGYLILGFGENGAYDYMFATVLAVLIVAVATDRVYLAFMGGALRWHESQA